MPPAQRLMCNQHILVYVGDDLTLDVLGAQQAGLRAVWMNRFQRKLQCHVRPDAVCTNLTELALWLVAYYLCEKMHEKTQHWQPCRRIVRINACN